MPIRKSFQPIDGRLEVARQASIDAGAFVRSQLVIRKTLEVRQKNPQEFVSDLDAATERHIRNTLASVYPDDDVQGEELGGKQTSAYWSVDPIDGTANFLRGSPLWGISIAYVVGGITSVGVVSLPVLDLTLSATSDSQLFLNGEPYDLPAESGIRVVGLGENPYWKEIEKLERAFRAADWGIAEYRSATVGLAFAALGYTDGYIEYKTNMWDIAAGMLLCERAGLTTISGTLDRCDSPRRWIQAGTEEALEVVASANIESN